MKTTAPTGEDAKDKTADSAVPDDKPADSGAPESEPANAAAPEGQPTAGEHAVDGALEDGPADGGTSESEPAKTEAAILEGQLTEDEQEVLKAYRVYRDGLLGRKRAREAQRKKQQDKKQK